jgi:hypothetical protein
VAISAVDSLAKLHGFYIARKERGAPGDFARLTDEQLNAELRKYGIAVDDQPARA